MKKYIALFAGFMASFIVVMAFQPSKVGGSDSDPDKDIAILKSTLAYLERMHFEPIVLDDEFSKEAFDKYIKSLDRGKRLLILPEVEEMKKFQTQIDDQLKMGSLDLFELSFQLSVHGIERAESLYRKIIDQSQFSFETDEYFELDADKRIFANNAMELEKFWRNLLKHDVLSRYTREKSRQEKRLANEAVEDSEEEDFFEEEEISDSEEWLTDQQLYDKACDAVKKNYDRWFKRMGKLKREDYFSLYVNAITETFDPHSNYFTPKNKDDFNTSMSGRLIGIGATLRTDDEYTKVMSVVPGGPAWKQKQLEVNDLILKVKQEGEEPVDIMGMLIDEVVGMIRGEKDTKVTLTVRKVDGAIKEITIVRDEVIIDEGFVKSAIIDVPGVLDRVGYIRLPKFYADFERPEGASSAEDVAKELEKLKRASVNGIILDLRNNGGGSLRDVVQMSGLFIESGPIVQVKDRNRAPYSLNDRDSDVQYDGPLIVMVNSFSASASEILAAAMQDYNRAIIVGSESTFGKGTVQRFVGIDGRVVGRGSDPLGDIKITTQKFYRVNGGSTQLKGVNADIVLPDTYMYIDVGEREYEKPMPWTEIEPVKYSQNVYLPVNKSTLKKLSNDRVSKNEVFTRIDQNAKILKEESEDSLVPLNFEKYYAELKATEERSKKFRNLFSANESMKIRNPQEDLEYIQLDSSRIERNEDWFKSIRKDIYLEESVSILRDMIEIQKKADNSSNPR
jgi:carboxyl-terminal processing protease